MDQNLTIGRLLKKVREEKKISLEDVASKTKININILRALEKDDLESLPNKTYVKGFVKNYAKTIGLSSEEALEVLEKNYQTTNPNTVEEQAQELVHPKEKELEIGEIQDQLKGIFGSVLNKKVFMAIGAVALLYLLGKGALGIYTNINKETDSLPNQEAKLKEIEKISVNDIKPKDASLFELESSKKIGADNPPAEKIEPEPKEEVADANSDEAEATPAESSVPEDETKEAAQALPPGKFPHVNFYPAPRDLFTVSADAPEVNDESLLPENIKDSMDSDKHNLFINAIEGDTWLSYQVDGEDVKRFVLKKGRSLFIQAKEVILLFMGNLNATKIFYNNQLVEAETRTGVKSLIFPENKAADYDFPLFPSYKGVPYRQDVYKKNMVEKPAS